MGHISKSTRLFSSFIMKRARVRDEPHTGKARKCESLNLLCDTSVALGVCCARISEPGFNTTIFERASQ